MFHFPRFPPACAGDGAFRRRVAPFGYPRLDACLRLPVAFRSLPRPSSALGAKASTVCPFCLDLFSPLDAHCAYGLRRASGLPFAPRFFLLPL